MDFENARITKADITYNGEIELRLETGCGGVTVYFKLYKLPKILEELRVESFSELEGKYLQITPTDVGEEVEGIRNIFRECEDTLWIKTDNNHYTEELINGVYWDKEKFEKEHPEGLEEYINNHIKREYLKQNEIIDDEEESLFDSLKLIKYSLNKVEEEINELKKDYKTLNIKQENIEEYIEECLKHKNNDFHTTTFKYPYDWDKEMNYDWWRVK